MSLTTVPPLFRGGHGEPSAARGWRVAAERHAGAPLLRVVRDGDLDGRAGSAGPARPLVPVDPAGPVRSAARSDAPLRLTRRGRLVVRVGGVLLVALALAAGVVLLGRTAEAGSTAKPVAVSYRVVLPGETLWQIAAEVAPGVDRRDTIADILDLNALSTAQVYAGQRIAVPVRPGGAR